MDLENEMIKLGHGEIHALENIYTEMKNAVFALCFSVVHNYHNAQDMMQETFVKVKKYILYYKPGTNPRAWILTIAKNTCFNFLANRKKEVALDFEDQIEDEQKLQAHDESGVILLATKTLKKINLQIVLLHTIGDITLHDIAKALRISEGTVRWKYNVSIKKLKQAYEKEEQNGRN